MPYDMFSNPVEWAAEEREQTIRETMERMRTDADRQQSRKELGAGTDARSERHIFDATFSKAGQDNDVDAEDAGDTRELVEDQSRMHGWNDEFVPDAEGMVRAIQGDEVDGYIGDRPLQHQHEVSVDQENRSLRARLEAMERAQQQASPQAEAQRQAHRENVRAALIDTTFDDEKLDGFIRDGNSMVQSSQQIINQRGEESMQRAQRTYGRDFDNVYAAVSQMDMRNPLAREIINSVRNSPDPGEALMELHGNDLVSSLGAGRTTTSPPFAGGRPVRGSMQRVHRDEDSELNSGYGNADVESAVFDDVWKDY